jgi:hypothetical protein
MLVIYLLLNLCLGILSKVITVSGEERSRTKQPLPVCVESGFLV